MKKITPLLVCFTLFCFLRAHSSTTYQLNVTVYGSPSNSPQFDSTGYSIQGNIVEYNACGAQPSIHIAIIDTTSCSPLNTCNTNFGQANVFTDPDGDCINGAGSIYFCRARFENYFIYRTVDINSIRSMAHLLYSVEDGHIIIAYSMFPVQYSTMDTSFINVFQRLGSAMMPSMPDTVPFIFYCRKGDASSINEVIGASSSSLITLDVTYDCSPTGIDEINSETFHVYPNPAIDDLRIEFPGQGDIRMFNVTGKVVFQKPDVQNNIVVNTSGYGSGIYFLELTTAGNRICKKVSVCKE